LAGNTGSLDTDSHHIYVGAGGALVTGGVTKRRTAHTACTTLLVDVNGG